MVPKKLTAQLFKNNSTMATSTEMVQNSLNHIEGF